MLLTLEDRFGSPICNWVWNWGCSNLRNDEEYFIIVGIYNPEFFWGLSVSVWTGDGDEEWVDRCRNPN